MIDIVKRRIRQVPGARATHQRITAVLEDRKLRNRTNKDTFTTIYEQNDWVGKESASGPGSDLAQASAVIGMLPELLEAYGIESLLDVPCGDFRWMQLVDLGDRRYTGGDIVTPLIRENQIRFGSPTMDFVELDLINHALPTADLVLCRDCLVHFSFQDIYRALSNIVASKASYLLTTTFTDRSVNSDITTGRWRPLNLQAAPFDLPAPLQLTFEQCTEGDGAYADKALALWRVSDIAGHLAAAPRR